MGKGREGVRGREDRMGGEGRGGRNRGRKEEGKLGEKEK